MTKIASAADASIASMLRNHPSAPEVLEYAEDGANAWDVPPDAEVLFTYMRNWRAAPKDAPEGWPFNLKWVQIVSAGIDAYPSWLFDVPLVTTGRGLTAEPIAEYVIAAIFAHEKAFFDDLLVTSPDGWVKRPLGQVAGKRLGIAGFGAIGQAVAAKARALGMEVATVTRSTRPEGVTLFPDLAAMIAEVDHLVLATPLTDATRGMVDAALLAKAKPGLHLINISRGEVVVDADLIAALDAGTLSAATLDVTAPEPPPEGHGFYAHPKVRLTPHLSFWTDGGAERTLKLMRDNLDAWLDGKPLQNIIPKGRDY